MFRVDSISSSLEIGQEMQYELLFYVVGDLLHYPYYRALLSSPPLRILADLGVLIYPRKRPPDRMLALGDL